MILDRARELEESAKNLRQRQNVTHLRSAWMTATNSFEGRLARITAPLAFIRWLSDHCSQEDDVTAGDVIGVATSRMNALIEALLTRPEMVLTSNQISDALRSVDKAIDALEIRAKDSWATHLGHSGWSPANLWIAFRSHAEFAPHVNAALEQDRLYERLRGLPYPDDAAQRKYTELIEQRSQLVKRLPDISDEEVKNFVMAAGSRGATLSTLTPGVLRWLSENNLTQAYIVRQGDL